MRGNSSLFQTLLVPFVWLGTFIVIIEISMASRARSLQYTYEESKHKTYVTFSSTSLKMKSCLLETPWYCLK